MLNHTAAKALAVALLAGWMTGCDQSAPTESAPKDPSAASSLPDAMILAESPDGARGIRELKAEAKEGEKVVLSGFIGGRAEPYVKGRAVMTVVDSSMTSECTKPGDSCATPWDYCCAEPKALLEQMATVQFLNAEGQPLRIDLKQDKRLAPLTEVLIEGTVAKRTDPNALVVNATGIHVKSKP